MNTSVLFFFLSNIVATALLGGKFAMRSDSVFKYFGFGLLLDSAAFALWTIGYMNPGQLLPFVTYGAIAFLISLVVFLYASLQQTPASTRLFVTLLGAAALIGIFYIGNSSSNSAYISTEGFLFFNLTPLVQMLYLFGLAFASLPLIDIVASKLKAPYSALVRYGFITEVVGGIMLITNKDVQVLYITGWIIGIVYFALWATLLFDRKALSN